MKILGNWSVLWWINVETDCLISLKEEEAEDGEKKIVYFSPLAIRRKQFKDIFSAFFLNLKFQANRIIKHIIAFNQGNLLREIGVLGASRNSLRWSCVSLIHTKTEIETLHCDDGMIFLFFFSFFSFFGDFCFDEKRVPCCHVCQIYNTKNVRRQLP